MNTLSSKTISFIRIPLMILVISIHTNLYQFMNGTSFIKKGDYFFYDLFNNIITVH